MVLLSGYAEITKIFLNADLLRIANFDSGFSRSGGFRIAILENFSTPWRLFFFHPPPDKPTYWQTSTNNSAKDFPTLKCIR
jgi:hypothetical protein